MLVARLGYSPARGGSLMARMDDPPSELPLALPVHSRRPELLHAVIGMEDYAMVPVVRAKTCLVGRTEERPVLAREHAGKKPKTYIEARGRIHVQSPPPPYAAQPPEAPAGSRELQGVLAAASPVFETPEETYFILVFAEIDKPVYIIGTECAAWRCLVQIGASYRLCGVFEHSTRLVLGPDPPLNALTSLAGDSTAVAVALGQPTDPWPDNLYSYQGRVTGRLGECIVELDGSLRLYCTHGALAPFQTLGIRTGCVVVLQNVCAVFIRRQLAGFALTLRSEVAVLRFAPSPTTPHLRFEPPDVSFAAVDAVDSVGVLDMLANVPREHQTASAALLVHHVAASRAFNRPAKDAEFLSAWESVCPADSRHVAAPVSLAKTVDGALGVAAGQPMHAHAVSVRRTPALGPCVAAVVCSAVTGQLCVADATAQIEAVFRPGSGTAATAQGPSAGSVVLLTEFDVVVERFGVCAAPSSEEVARGLLPGKVANGEALFHGHVSAGDRDGLTRAWVDCRAWIAGEAAADVAVGAPSSPSDAEPFALAPAMVGPVLRTHGGGGGGGGRFRCRVEAGNGDAVVFNGFPAGFAALALARMVCVVSGATRARHGGAVHCDASARVESMGVAAPRPVCSVAEALAAAHKTAVLPAVLGVVVAASLGDGIDERANAGGLPVAWGAQRQLVLTLRDAATPVTMTAYLDLGGALPGPGVVEIGALVCVQGCAVRVSSSRKTERALKGQARVELWNNGSVPVRVARFPADLGTLARRRLRDIRATQGGGMVLVSVMHVFEVRYERRVDALSAYVLVRCVISDGTDEATVFCNDETLAWDLLGVPEHVRVAVRANHNPAVTPVLKYQPDAPPMDGSPAAELAATVQAHLTAKPRLAFVVWDRPFEPAGAGDDAASAAARKTFIATTGYGKAQTGTVPKLCVRLLSVDKSEGGGGGGVQASAWKLLESLDG